MINKKFESNIEVKYYDGVPTSEKEVEEYDVESEGEDDTIL